MVMAHRMRVRKTSALPVSPHARCARRSLNSGIVFSLSLRPAVNRQSPGVNRQPPVVDRQPPAVSGQCFVRR